ncbi:KptA family-domain-containing protein [Tricladium varicosporioides]|nr:KptA family-domain-containing protein [Hymenoscyphus varicosporioides]
MNMLKGLSRISRLSNLPLANTLPSKLHSENLPFAITRKMADLRASEDLGSMPEGLDIEERFHGRGSQGGGRTRGKGGRGGRGGGGGGKGLDREVAVSKALSKLLRHAADDAGIKLDTEGYAKLDEVMKWNRLKSLQISFTDIQTAVTDNAKQRFSMKINPAIIPIPDQTSTNPSDYLIRANQGHSIAIDAASLLKPITLTNPSTVPSEVIHGTYYAFYSSIISTGGLKPMTRTHIHCSSGLPSNTTVSGKQVISGMRNDADLLIYIDIEKSLKDEAMKWWISDNGVILTEGGEGGVLATKYFKLVVGRDENVCPVLWEDGEEIAQLPEKLRGRKPPTGKGHVGRGGRGARGGRGGRGGARGGRGDGEGVSKGAEAGPSAGGEVVEP